MRLEPSNIQQIGDELAIAWNDGTESFLKLELLRRACPCAACGGEPDVLGQVVRPHVSHTDKSFELVGFDLVGGYALQGHVHCVYAPRRTIAAENKRDAHQKSAAHQAVLDSGLRLSQRSVTAFTCSALMERC